MFQVLKMPLNLLIFKVFYFAYSVLLSLKGFTVLKRFHVVQSFTANSPVIYFPIVKCVRTLGNSLSKTVRTCKRCTKTICVNVCRTNKWQWSCRDVHSAKRSGRPRPRLLVSSGQADCSKNGQGSHGHDQTYGWPSNLLRNVTQHSPLQTETKSHCKPLKTLNPNLGAAAPRIPLTSSKGVVVG